MTLVMSGSSQRPHLRLVEDSRVAGASRPGRWTPAEDRVPQQGADPVLVAAADVSARARMLAELRSLLPPGTRFLEAGETWEVVARAADSRMVVIAGDLHEASSSSLLRLLARRNPALPVLAARA